MVLVVCPKEFFMYIVMYKMEHEFPAARMIVDRPTVSPLEDDSIDCY